MSNRVEELERQVTELRAAVDGLTEELVETKERLRQLENAAVAESESEPEPEATAEDAESSGETRRRAGDVHAEMVTTEERHLPDDAGGGESEADKAAEGDQTDDGEESEGSDIIVA